MPALLQNVKNITQEVKTHRAIAPKSLYLKADNKGLEIVESFFLNDFNQMVENTIIKGANSPNTTYLFL